MVGTDGEVDQGGGTVSKLKRTVTWRPAYDKRDPDPEKNCGVHGMDLRFILSGPKGAAQFVVYTGWHLAHVRERPMSVQPADVGYHALKPAYEDQTQMDCDLVEGGKCYYDGSGLQAEELFDRFVAEGEEVVWAELLMVYKEKCR